MSFFFFFFGGCACFSRAHHTVPMLLCLCFVVCDPSLPLLLLVLLTVYAGMIVDEGDEAVMIPVNCVLCRKAVNRDQYCMLLNSVFKDICVFFVCNVAPNTTPWQLDLRTV